MTKDLREPGRAVGMEAAGPDPAALWAEFAPPLRGFLARRVPAGVDADDLVQEVFLRVIRHAGSLRSTDRPEAWLFQIARNALRDFLRARLRRDGRNDAIESDDDLAAEPDAAAERAAEAELAPCLTSMVNRLPEPYRTAITLTTVNGISQADAARQLGISISGMKSRVQRGRDRLRDMLIQCCSIAVDVRGGVSDFYLRSAGACDPPAAAGSSVRVPRTRVPPRRSQLRPIHGNGVFSTECRDRRGLELRRPSCRTPRPPAQPRPTPLFLEAAVAEVLLRREPAHAARVTRR